ncbi:hypothetical protein JT359_05450 [Candidatus Poribacteria bacterium]|nr:hypothetical protein [Candidatus Poribacteria bacterium]
MIDPNGFKAALLKLHGYYGLTWADLLLEILTDFPDLMVLTPEIEKEMTAEELSELKKQKVAFDEKYKDTFNDLFSENYSKERKRIPFLVLYPIFKTFMKL